MKRKLKFIIAIIMIATTLMAIFPAVSHADADDGAAALANLQALLPDTVNVKVTAAVPGDPAYFPTVIVSGGTMLDGTYLGWCVDAHHPIQIDTVYLAHVFSSYETLPFGLFNYPENLDLVNWIINQDYVGKPFPGGINPYFYGDVQMAIWILLEGTPSIPPNLPGIGPYASSHIARIIADATASGEGFVPCIGQWVAIILDFGTDAQTIFIEYELTNPPTTTPPLTVGGEIYPVNKIIVLAPFLALFAIIVAGCAITLGRKRNVKIQR